MKNILFVCTGNTCRSCMAEGIFNHVVQGEDKLEGVKALSAGISAFNGDGSNPKAQKVLKELFGIDVSSHKSMRLNEKDIQRADIILTMTKSHKEMILSIMPQEKVKTWTLKEYVLGDEKKDESMDVNDPYGMDELEYKKCAKQLKYLIDGLITKLKKE
ncbi:low molecular weight protein arginine phosphatase [Herbivorax sp. ANBcel31]|uniref:low molecular weight protein arginine phosphatase n=1 Tax=Herbivorax sp. ANBcel31 TaxID=3069754 RepID=UPI0027ADC664|nr:low molecular weight protein arginine phosphatase [Herbivorax sp. ANBcel31]MDQ2087674.1 low molecular weight protein arginine phosphatase [Herbivorax sp. ANBcel31]